MNVLLTLPGAAGNGLPNPAITQRQIIDIVTACKKWQDKSLTVKYFFNPSYSYDVTQYTMGPMGNLQASQRLMEETINDYLTQF